MPSSLCPSWFHSDTLVTPKADQRLAVPDGRLLFPVDSFGCWANSRPCNVISAKAAPFDANGYRNAFNKYLTEVFSIKDLLDSTVAPLSTT